MQLRVAWTASSRCKQPWLRMLSEAESAKRMRSLGNADVGGRAMRSNVPKCIEYVALPCVLEAWGYAMINGTQKAAGYGDEDFGTMFGAGPYVVPKHSIQGYNGSNTRRFTL